LLNNLYLYNGGTGKLHIAGCCQYAGRGGGLQKFNSEEEALSTLGHPFIMCKICQKKRDKLIKEQTII